MSSNYHIPGTNVKAEILKPEEGKEFVSLFYSKNEHHANAMASVNAGTSNSGSVFAVGLGGINGAFQNALSNAGQNTGRYQVIHQGLYDSLDSGEKEKVKTDFESTDPVVLSMIRLPESLTELPKYDGIAFIDVFKAEQTPHSNKSNYGMAYVVPPDYSNYDTKSDFLKAIESSSECIVLAINSYNNNYANDDENDLLTIQTIRMCLFSGGIYRGAASTDEVAHANLNGLVKGFKKVGSNSGVSLIQFEFSNVKTWLE